MIDCIFVLCVRVERILVFHWITLNRIVCFVVICDYYINTFRLEFDFKWWLFAANRTNQLHTQIKMPLKRFINLSECVCCALPLILLGFIQSIEISNGKTILCVRSNHIFSTFQLHAASKQHTVWASVDIYLSKGLLEPHKITLFAC